MWKVKKAVDIVPVSHDRLPVQDFLRGDETCILKKRIISFTLYGTKEIYYEGALANAAMARQYYPGWECRIYISQEVPEQFAQKLASSGVHVIRKIRKKMYHPMLWRVAAAYDENVDAVIFRDLDSRLSAREAGAVQQWLDSGKSFHIMRDHPCHISLIMGGMWGVRGGILPGLHALLWIFFLRNMHLLFCPGGFWGARDFDQVFFNQMIYPMTRDDVVIHTDFVAYETENILPFPVARTRGEYVGQAVEHGIPLNPLKEEIMGNSPRILPRLKFHFFARIARKIKSFIAKKQE